MSPGGRNRLLGAVLLLAAGIVALLATGEGDDRGEPVRDYGDASTLMGTVTSVVDGDTIRVALPGGGERVRYIGVDTPESVAPGQPVECFGREASRRNEDLVAGRQVRLELGAERRDRYGRLLGYVHVGDTFVNAALVRAGYARTLEIEPNTRFAPMFERLQQRASIAGRGLWGAC